MEARLSFRPSTRAAWALGALLLIIPAVATAQNDPRAEARQHFDAGVAHFERGEYQPALDEFRQAYRIRPHPSVLVNMANCFMNLQKPIDAAVHFERYLREAGEIDAARRTEIEQALGRARSAIATIDVAGGDGIQVFVDGEASGRTPLRRPVELNPGPHVVELRFPNGGVQNERVRLAQGQALTVEARPGAASSGTGGGDTGGGDTGGGDTGGGDTGDVYTGGDTGGRDTGGGDTSGGDTGGGDTGGGDVGGGDVDTGGGLQIPLLTWIGGGVFVVGLAAGIGFGATALAQQTEFEGILRDLDVARDEGAPPEEIEYLQDNGQAVADAQASNALLADVCFVLAAAGAGVAVYFFITGQDEEEPASVAAIPILLPEGGGFAVAGTL